MLYSEFDDLLPPEDREMNKEGGGFSPEHLRQEIDEMNEWVYNTINNGVYKCGFATSQESYDAAIYTLFQSLSRLESHLAGNTTRNNSVGSIGSPTTTSSKGPYLLDPHLTEADIRLYPTIIRFDAAYHTIFRCNLKSVRHDYPNLNRWPKLLYWGPPLLPPAAATDDSSTPITAPTARKASINVSRRASRRASSISGFQASSTLTSPADRVNEDDMFTNMANLNPSTATSTLAPPPPRQTVFQRTTHFEAYRRGYAKAVAGLRAKEARDGVIVPRGPVEGIEALSESEGGWDRRHSLLPENLLSHSQAHQSENRRWQETAKQVERDAGGAMLHLSLA